MPGLRSPVDWGSLPFTCFMALLNTLRQMGARKSDLIAPTHAEFDRSRIARSNITFRIAGVDYDDPTIEQLLSMTEGDLVLIRPGASKPDQVGLLWGDKPVALPYHAGDLLNLRHRA